MSNEELKTSGENPNTRKKVQIYGLEFLRIDNALITVIDKTRIMKRILPQIYREINNSAIYRDFTRLCNSAVGLNLPEGVGGSIDEHEIVKTFVDVNREFN